MTKQTKEKLKELEMIPPLFYDEIIGRLERNVMNDKFFGRNPKRDFSAMMNLRMLEKIKRQVNGV